MRQRWARSLQLAINHCLVGPTGSSTGAQQWLGGCRLFYDNCHNPREGTGLWLWQFLKGGHVPYLFPLYYSLSPLLIL
jgi:hypothetical protein